MANRLNYHPHPYARGLARKKTNSILALIPFFSTFFFIEVLRGVQSNLSESDFDLILYGLNHPDHVGDSLRKHALRGRGDGILFFSMRMPEEFVNEYLRQKVPVVLIDTFHKNFDSFFVDNSEGARIATNHLISLGHTRIGILLANLESTPARQRLEGFRRAMNEANLEVRPSWIKRSSSAKLDGFTKETGHELMKEFLQSRFEMPTAVFVSSDIQAAGALDALEEAGLKCPDDMAMVGFDDIELAGYLGLTTMRQPMFEIGSLAAARLRERMQDLTLSPKETAFVPKLVIRETTAQVEKQQIGDVVPSSPV